MLEDDISPVDSAATVEVADEPEVFAKGRMEFHRGIAEPVMIVDGDLPEDEDTETVEAVAPPEEPVTIPDVPRPPEARKALADLLREYTDEEMAEFIQGDPRIQRRVAGEVGSKLQRDLDSVRREAGEKALREAAEDTRLFNVALAKYEEIEALTDTDPETYEREHNGSPDYHRWVASLQTWANRREAQAAQGTKTTPTDGSFEGWNSVAIREAQSIIQAETPFYKDLPRDVRLAIETAKFDPNENWMQSLLRAYTKGAQTHFETAQRTAIAAAHEAGRNEALAERGGDRAVVVNPPSQKLSAREVVRRHASGERFPQAQKDAAFKELGW